MKIVPIYDVYRREHLGTPLFALTRRCSHWVPFEMDSYEWVCRCYVGLGAIGLFTVQLAKVQGAALVLAADLKAL